MANPVFLCLSECDECILNAFYVHIQGDKGGASSTQKTGHFLRGEAEQKSHALDLPQNVNLEQTDDAKDDEQC